MYEPTSDVPVDDFTIALPNAPATAGSARRFVAERVGGHPRRAELLVCVSELVTNAIVHTRSSPTVRIILRRARIRIEVADDSPALPVMGPPDVMATGGRGLRIVDHLSLDWGATPHRDGAGKVVWFEFEGTQAA
jgi:anti-sigma regulatory factor (Ser/Thr protein kinase)